MPLEILAVIARPGMEVETVMGSGRDWILQLDTDPPTGMELIVTVPDRPDMGDVKSAARACVLEFLGVVVSREKITVVHCGQSPEKS